MRDLSSRIVRQINMSFPKPTQVRPILRVAAYCRASTDHDEQLGSLSYQQKYYQELIESTNGWQMAGIYVDNANSIRKVIGEFSNRNIHSPNGHTQ